MDSQTVGADEWAGEARALDVLAVLGEKAKVFEFAEPVAESPDRVIHAIGVLMGLVFLDVGDMSEEAPRQEDASHATSPPHRSSTGSDNRAAMVSQ